MIPLAFAPRTTFLWVCYAALVPCPDASFQFHFRISSLPQLAFAVRDLESLLILGNPTAKKPVVDAKKKQRAVDEPYDRSAYWGYAADTKTAFQKLYTFCFVLAKQE